MYTDNHPELRSAVNAHLELTSGEASKANFEKAKSELIFTKTAVHKAISHLTMERYLEIAGQRSQEATPVEKSAADMVENCFIPLPSETIDAAFARSKLESIAKLKKQVTQLKVFSFKDYSVKRKKTGSAKKVRSTNFDNVRIERKRTS